MTIRLAVLVSLALASAFAVAQTARPEPAAEPRSFEPSGESMFDSTAAPATEDESRRVMRALPGDLELPALLVDGVLVDGDGMSLYRYTRDRVNASTCYRICATLWPPLLADIDDEAVGDFTVVHRRDGALQWAWRGHPLYRWAKDEKPGDITGDSINEVWYVLRVSEPPKVAGR